jgi:hypothetical protein
VNFTREPIIETIITPKEGYKLIVRNSSGVTEEECYSVDAVEVVSFGRSFFFRSLEKPKAFLLPVTNYEIIETRETRTVLKRPQIEKTIKIGGGKPAPEKVKEEERIEGREEGKRKKRPRKYRGHEEREPKREMETKGGDIEDETEKVSSSGGRRTLLPPPTSLISEQIGRYKDYLYSQGSLLPEELEEQPLPESEVGTEEEPNFPQPVEEEPLFPEETLTEEEEKIVELPEEETMPPLPEDE